MIGEEKGSVAISGRSSHKMTGLLVDFPERKAWKRWWLSARMTSGKFGPEVNMAELVVDVEQVENPRFWLVS